MGNLMEGPNVEFKRMWVDGAKRSAVAFLNTSGGVIYLGVDDDGIAIGTDDADEQMRRATQAISGGIHPDPMSFISVETETMDGVTVVAVHVQRGARRPYYLTDKGVRPAGVYIRSGAASIPASESMIIDMVRQTSGNSFEDALSLHQDLTFVAAGNAFAQAGLTFTPASQRTLGMIGPDNAYTNLAWLLSDQCTVSVKAAVFGDGNKEQFVNRQEFNGSVLLQFDQLLAFVGRYNPVSSTLGDDWRRIDDYGYSPLVLREALLNMIVHRDYGLSGPSLVSIFDDRMELVNLGGLPDNLTRADMFTGISVQRNPKLANVFYRLGLVEAYGTGIRRIMGAYSGSENLPTFEISDHAFKLTLPCRGSAGTSAPPEKNPQGQPAVHPHNETENKAVVETETALENRWNENRSRVVEQARISGSISRKQVERITGMSQAAAARLLRDMVKAGDLVRVGGGPATAYQPV